MWFSILLLIAIILGVITHAWRIYRPGSLQPTTGTDLGDLITGILFAIGVLHFYILGGS